MPDGLAHIGQADFSGGMFRAVRPDLIPPNGAYDIYNGLLDDGGSIFKRGGSSYRSSSAFGAALTFVWDGWLNGGHRTVTANAADFGVLNDDGSVSNLGGAGLPGPYYRAAAHRGSLFIPGGVTYDGVSLGSITTVADYYAVAADRLFAGVGSQVRFSGIGTPTAAFDPTDFHEIPAGAQIKGLEGLRDAVAVFTTQGIWVISNLGFDLTDADGNVQHRVDYYSRDVVLWGNSGVAGFAGGLVVPAMDAVWLVSLGVTSEVQVPFARISDPIASLYQEYVRAGYQPGQAAVYRSHYFLPILDGLRLVDMLVCKLNLPGRPWTRLAGYGAQLTGLAVRSPQAVTTAPALIGASATNGRVLDLHYLEPGATTAFDADGSAPDHFVEPRSYPTGNGFNRNTVLRLVADYQLVPVNTAPVVEASWLSGRAPVGGSAWGSAAWGTGTWSASSTETLLGGQAPPDQFGLTPYAWHVGRRERLAHFRLRLVQPAAQMTLRSLRIDVRSNGRA